MNPSDVLRLVIRAVTERRLRSTLTILGIIIGPAAMVSIIGATKGFTTVITEQLTSLGQNTVIVLPAKDYKLTYSDVLKLRRIPFISHITPFYQATGELRKPDGEKVRVTVYAFDLVILTRVIAGLEVDEGRIPPARAYSSCVLGSDIATSEKTGIRLYKPGSAITVKVPIIEDDSITVKNLNFIVSAVLKPYGTMMFVNPDKSMFLPLDAGKALLAQQYYTGIFIVVRDADRVEDVVRMIRDMYGDYVEVVSIKQIAKTVGNIIHILDVLLFSTSSVSFAVAVTGIMATMFTSVMERTREIGIMKAVGFTSRQIMILMLSESLFMSVIGGIVGVAAGAVGAYILTGRTLSFAENIAFTAQPAITPDLVAEALFMAVAVGVFGGILPAFRASRLPPVEALRYE